MRNCGNTSSRVSFALRVPQYAQTFGLTMRSALLVAQLYVNRWRERFDALLQLVICCGYLFGDVARLKGLLAESRLPVQPACGSIEQRVRASECHGYVWARVGCGCHQLEHLLFGVVEVARGAQRPRARRRPQLGWYPGNFARVVAPEILHGAAPSVHDGYLRGNLVRRL